MMTELKCFERNQRMNHTLSSSSSSTLSVSCEGWREGWLSCSQTVPVPVFERDMVARLNLYAEVDVPTVLMEVFPWYAEKQGEIKSKSLSRKVCSLGGHICNASEQPIQDQVLSKLMGKSWNLKNGSPNSQLNYTFQISKIILKITAPLMLFLLLK